MTAAEKRRDELMRREKGELVDLIVVLEHQLSRVKVQHIAGLTRAAVQDAGRARLIKGVWK